MTFAGDAEEVFVLMAHFQVLNFRYASGQKDSVDPAKY